ncbi:glucose dehydrogenase [Cryobacterium sp. LW097]|uniref:PQQ-dependent sugar dehydrogenase n=1 Tax=Cryobacterium sp. LW097 TaxID=1978566 RepID=UPI000B4C6454|nr:PQQ-dependent sugar dehydrogenase [Cryobacterium sp. LW097]ASD22558.1 glucose dehydrogenase [Cryobacterium sp. LW097]
MTRMTHQLRSVAVAAALAVLLASCSVDPDPRPTTASPAAPDASPSEAHTPDALAALGQDAVPIATGLAAPWSVTFVGDTAIISERDSARILELSPDGTPREIATVAGVNSNGEAGLLGIAVDNQNRLFVYSTGNDGNRIQRFDITGTPGSLGLNAPVTILDGIPAANYHDGGRLAFGPDGMLYATIGDAGQRTAAQDLDSLSGKILRMNTDGVAPDDNPFPGSLVYSYGHRNPQGIAWAEDGTMFATEFGQDTWDELNIITAGSNYGWPTVEGIADETGLVDPVQQWTPDEASPSGMTQISGTLFIANLRGEVLRAIPVADPSTHTDYFVGEYGRLRDAALAPDGSLWFLTSNTDGRGDPTSEDDRIMTVEIVR